MFNTVTPQNNSNVIFRIHSEPKSMLLKNARIAFNDSLLNPKVVGHLGSVGPITDFTPQASRSLPARLGGTGANGRDFGPQNEALIIAADAYHRHLDQATIPGRRTGSAFANALSAVAGDETQDSNLGFDHEHTPQGPSSAAARHPQGLSDDVEGIPRGMIDEDTRRLS